MIQIDDKTMCCGCQACAAVCGKSAISMAEDEYGNTFPRVDESKCVHCGLCDQVCPLQNDNAFHQTAEAYAVSLSDRERLKNSASGGAFYGIASAFLKDVGGVVYGCAYNDEMLPVIESAETVDELSKFQGSKYAMSTIGTNVYKEIRETLRSGKKILFSGVPCQCSAIRTYCRGCEDGLYTVELICHGFTNQHYFSDYVHVLNRQTGGKVVDFRFRSKDMGPFVARYVARKDAGRGKSAEKAYHTNPATSYYYNNFLSGKIYRENCYVCRYAKNERASDLTIGDFWGYEGELCKNGSVSAVLCNTEKGSELFRYAKVFFAVEAAKIADIAKNNEQLNRPISKARQDYSILTEWKEKGAEYQNQTHIRKHFKAYIASKFDLFR